MKTVFDLIKNVINAQQLNTTISSIDIKRKCKEYYQQVIGTATIAVYLTKLIKTGYLNATTIGGIYTIVKKLPEDFTVTKLDIEYNAVLRENKLKHVPALDIQVGGNHYKKYSYQPVEFSVDARLSFIQGSIIKYILRFQDKNGIEDINKVIHYADLARELKLPVKPKNYQATYLHRFCTENKLNSLQSEITKKAYFGNFAEITKICKEYINTILSNTNE